MKYQAIDINSNRVIILQLEAEFVTGVINNQVKDVFLSVPLNSIFFFFALQNGFYFFSHAWQ